VQIIDFATGKLIYQHDCDGTVSSVAWSPKENLLAATVGRNIVIFRVR
jgi:hypothetical protein